MNNYNILFISPHLDDAVYSCSQLIRYMKNNNRILVVSIFTQYNNKNKNVFTNGEKRFQEDKDAMESIGIDKLYLNYPELMIRNNMNDYSLYNQIIEPIKTLFHCKNDNYLTYSINYDIQNIIDEHNIEEVYFPAGIGFHPDHILTYRSCYNLKNVKLLVYEDFPYCINNIYRFLRIPFINVKPHSIVKVSESLKKSDIMKYESQYKIIFENIDLEKILQSYYEKYYYV